MSSSADTHYMRSAISLARRGLGRTWPNPSVGCVIVKGGHVIARARTQDGGRPHAEKEALDAAGQSAKGATLYVTLEPCSHKGETGACVDAIIKSGVQRVVMGVDDVDPRVAGKSEEILRDAGIEVVSGILQEECEKVNAGFFTKIRKSRPFVTLKIACTLDGKIACASGESQWITGETARHHVQHIRAQHDAILVGVGTVLTDDPLLTTRLKGIDHKSVRIVLDNNLRTPVDSRLVQSANGTPLWILHKEKSSSKALENKAAVLHQVDCNNLEQVLELLADQGITRVLIEGGAGVHTSFLRAGLYDEVVVYRAPTVLGDEAKAAVNGFNIVTLKERHDLTLKSVEALGQDTLERYSKKVEA